MPDGWEVNYGFNPLSASDATLDFDADGLTNLGEYLNGTDPQNWDTDDDWLSDGVELVFSKTNPLNSDTDENGIEDGLQFIQGSGYTAKMEILPDGWTWIRIYWQGNEITVISNSSIMGVTFNSTQKSLTIKVSGSAGTSGVTNISVPKTMTNSTDDIAVYLNGAAFSFELSQNETYYFMHLEYNHSTLEFTSNFANTSGEVTGSAPTIDYMVYIAVFAAMALIILIAKREKSKAGEKAPKKDSGNGAKSSENKGKKQSPAQKPAIQRRLKDSGNGAKSSENKGKKQSPAQKPAIQRRLKTEKGN
jgi:hypothetical protein